MLQKKYRKIETTINYDKYTARIGINGTVVIGATDYYDIGRTSKYFMTLHADELLKTSKQCLRQLSTVSGIDYRIAVIIDNKVAKWL